MSEVYKIVGEIVQKVLNKQGTIRSLCYGENIRYKKAVFGLVCETLKYNRVLESLFSSHPILKKHFMSKNKYGLGKVLLYLITIAPQLDSKSNQKISGGGKDIKLIKNSALSLKLQLQKLIKVQKQKNKDQGIVETLSDSPLILLPFEIRNPMIVPRYVRINTIKITIEKVIAQFQKDGFEIVDKNPYLQDNNNNNNNNNNDVNNIVNNEEENTEETKEKTKIMWIDLDLPNLLCFPANTDLHDHQLVHSGSIILQDKASCMPAYVLLGDCIPSSAHIKHKNYINNNNQNKKKSKNNSNNEDINNKRDAQIYEIVLDACAAPGNKTTHLASLIWDHTKIYSLPPPHNLFAVDKDQRRLQTMIQLSQKVGVSDQFMTTINSSFLDLSPTDPRFKDVTHMQVDPSCSGSGIVSRFDSLLESVNSPQKFDSNRLTKLSSFQLDVVSHAMKFPKVKRVVYSTCSIHKEENEEVVAKILELNPNFQLVKALPNWNHRGLSSFPDIGEKCVRASPSVDFTNGFFVSCFERISDATLLSQSLAKDENEINIEIENNNNNNDNNNNQELEKEESSKEIQPWTIKPLKPLSSLTDEEIEEIISQDVLEIDEEEEVDYDDGLNDISEVEDEDVDGSLAKDFEENEVDEEDIDGSLAKDLEDKDDLDGSLARDFDDEDVDGSLVKDFEDKDDLDGSLARDFEDEDENVDGVEQDWIRANFSNNHHSIVATKGDDKFQFYQTINEKGDQGDNKVNFELGKRKRRSLSKRELITKIIKRKKFK